MRLRGFEQFKTIVVTFNLLEAVFKNQERFNIEYLSCKNKSYKLTAQEKSIKCLNVITFIYY